MNNEFYYPDEPDNPENFTYYYNREDRLKSANKMVQDYYNGQWKGPPKGLIKSLVHSKSSKFMFIVLCLVLCVVVIVMISNSRANVSTISGIKFELSAFKFEETIYVTLKCEQKKSSKNQEIQNQDIKVQFYCLDNSQNIVNKYEKTDFFKNNELFFRTTFKDYDIITIEAEILTKDQNQKLSCLVKEQ